MQPPQHFSTADLMTCDKEQIHLISGVQPHGVLLTLAEPELKVLQASANARSILQCDHSDVVGQHAVSLFSDSSIAGIRRILSSQPSDDILPARPCLITIRSEEMSFQGLLHRYDGVCILELEHASERNSEELLELRQWISVDFPQLFEFKSISDLLAVTVAEVQKLCDFDRVMVYQFDSEWNGAVVAEQKRDFMSSFVKHRFPASDIPAQARELYRKKLLRILVDVDALSSPLTTSIDPLTGKSLDLTYSVLRSMSPIHVEYLKNMGVAASMSISLIVRNELWGLIICHHKTAKTVDFATRSKCELVAKVISGLIEKIEDLENTRLQLELAEVMDKIVIGLNNTDNLTQALCLQLPHLVSAASASGIALVGNDILDLYGITPDKETVKRMFSWLCESVQEQIFCSDRLSLDYPQWREIAGPASGLIAINISTTSPLWILWFRPEQIEEVLWAGNPHKPVEIASNQGSINPRISFELWAEKVYGRSKSWKSFELEAARSVQKHIFILKLGEILRTEKTRKKFQQQREDVLAVLTHDLKVPVVAMDRVLPPLIADDTVPENVRAILRILQSANGKQRDRIYKLSQVLNYELGRGRLNVIERIDCAELIHESIAEVVLLPEQGDIKILTTINQFDHSFQSDRESICRLVVNLVSNAISAVGPTGTIQVTCECSVKGLYLQVNDNGTGIAKADKARIFDRFWHSDVTRSYSPHVGVGLYFSKQIVDSLEGTISCESEQGKGSTFNVRIPNAYNSKS